MNSPFIAHRYSPLISHSYPMNYMEVSLNGGTRSHHSSSIFHYKPSIFRVPPWLWKPPNHHSVAIQPPTFGRMSSSQEIRQLPCPTSRRAGRRPKWLISRENPMGFSGFWMDQWEYCTKRYHFHWIG